MSCYIENWQIKMLPTLNAVKPRLIVASCPHCMNAIGNEYRQIGGSYKVIHHTQYLESLVSPASWMWNGSMPALRTTTLAIRSTQRRVRCAPERFASVGK